MADTPIINVTDLTPIVASAIVTGQQVTIYDQAGVAYRAPLEDVYTAMKTLGSNYGLQTATLTIATADVLTLNATPVVFGLTVPAGYIPLMIFDPMFSSTFVSAAYAANTSLRVRSVGGSVDIVASTSILDFTATTQRLLDIQRGADNSLLYLDGTDLEVYVPTGDPTTGDSDITVTIFYILLPTPV